MRLFLIAGQSPGESIGDQGSGKNSVGSGERLVFRDLWMLEEIPCQLLGVCSFSIIQKGRRELKEYAKSFLLFRVEECR